VGDTGDTRPGDLRVCLSWPCKGRHVGSKLCPREKKAVRKEAKASGISVHFGQLMTIASLKFYELADHLHKMKGRIVYRGDCAKDEHRAAAVYQEL